MATVAQVLLGLGAAIVILAVVLGVPMMIDLSTEKRRRRHIVQKSAAEQQLRAMHAARELSNMAWQARRELYRLGNEGRAGSSTTARLPIRRT